MITAKRFPVYTGSIVFTGGGSRKTTTGGTTINRAQ